MGIHGGVARRALAPLSCGQGLACPFRQCVRLHSAAEPTGAIPQAERPAHVPSDRPAVDQPAGSPAGMVLIANLLDAGGHRGGSADPPPRALERRLARRSGPGHSPDRRGPEPRPDPSPAGSPARDGRPGAHRPGARPPPLARGPALGRLLPDPKRGEPRGPPHGALGVGRGEGHRPEARPALPSPAGQPHGQHGPRAHDAGRAGRPYHRCQYPGRFDA